MLSLSSVIFCVVEEIETIDDNKLEGLRVTVVYKGYAWRRVSTEYAAGGGVSMNRLSDRGHFEVTRHPAAWSKRQSGRFECRCETVGL